MTTRTIAAVAERLDRREAFDERAAIIADGCNVSRQESEKMAAEQMADYEIEFLQGGAD